MCIMKTPEFQEGAPAFEIESAKADDAESIARIQHDSWLATYQNDELGITRDVLEKRLGDLETRKEGWRKAIETMPEKIHIDVVRKDGRVIGFCKVSKREEENHIDALYLDPSEKKQGAGGKIFRAGLAWLGDERPISLEVVAYNDDSIAFYEHFGFERVGAGKGVDMRVDNIIMPDLVMRRPVKE